MRTLFLQAPSFDGFDGGAGARYQARREIRSYWYPTWLAQVAACVPDSKLIDAVPHRLPLADLVRDARNYDLAVLHTSTPSFASDVAVVEALKAAQEVFRPDLYEAAFGRTSQPQAASRPIGAFAGPAFEPEKLDAYFDAIQAGQKKP